MDLEKEWKNEHEEMFCQEEEEREESSWHHKDLNLNFYIKILFVFWKYPKFITKIVYFH